MTDDEIKTKIQQAILALGNETPPLEFARIHERSTAHRLAIHLENLFPEWNVDCEYDRDGEREKLLVGIMECNAQRATNRVLPDVIIHKRSASGHLNNLLVIELKKNSVEDCCDKRKLELFTADSSGYHYQLGLYINIANGDFLCTWYKEGHKQVHAAHNRA